MRRYEFPKAVKRAARERSGGRCEAAGEVYGLEPGERCYADLGRGVEYDHYPVPATERDSDTIDNCVACCPKCHGHKTRTFDTPTQAKVKRVSDKHLGIHQPKSKWPSRPLGTGRKQHTASKPLSKRIGCQEEA